MLEQVEAKGKKMDEVTLKIPRLSVGYIVTAVQALSSDYMTIYVGRKALSGS